MFKQSAEAAENETAALAALLISGSLKIYSGTRPASTAGAITGTLLATIPFDATPWTAGTVDGVYTQADTPITVTAAATGTATHARAWKADGTTAVFDVDASTTGTEVILASTSIVAATNVTLTGMTITFAQ